MQRWGLPENTKILWVHLDEKWFHGIVPRTNAKACLELGIEKASHSAHHKKHIAKVMAHCCVGYLIEGNVEMVEMDSLFHAIDVLAIKCLYEILITRAEMQ
jgi:hypothetical protein